MTDKIPNCAKCGKPETGHERDGSQLCWCAEPDVPPKHPGGRPTDLTEDLIARAAEYAAGGWHDEGDVVPTIEGLALSLGVGRNTLYSWEKLEEHDVGADRLVEFRDTLTYVRNMQARIVVNKGLNGDFNPAMSKFILSANHGMKERTDVTSDDKPLPDSTRAIETSEKLTKAVDAANEVMRKMLTE